MNIPECEFGLIGGSSTLSVQLPEEMDLDYVESGPGNGFCNAFWSESAFKLLSISSDEGQRDVLSCQMHGWRQGVSRADASRQVFWVFKQAGVKSILAEGGVGAVNHLLHPRDIVIPHDYMDFSMRKDVGLEDRYLLVMRESMCPTMRAFAWKSVRKNGRDGYLIAVFMSILMGVILKVRPRSTCSRWPELMW